MPSSSASSLSSKRKRNPAAPLLPDACRALPDGTQQPSSRDASAEEGDTTAPESGRHTRRSSNSVAGPNPKRLRASSDRGALDNGYGHGHGHGNGNGQGIISSSSTQNADADADADANPNSARDPGEPSDTTEASADIAERVGRKGRKVSARDAPEDKKNIPAHAPAPAATATATATVTMPAPPIGKITHPVGYKTNAPPVGRPVRVYADGVFDLFHLGHMRQLEQAKKAFPETVLVVGVTGDEETHRYKGLTVMSAKERAESLRHCKWVDEVIEDCPWIATLEFLDKHRLDYVAHDDLPYDSAGCDDIYRRIKEAGKFLPTQRTEGVSTTGIITRIVRDYEKYITRQFKRGTSRQELNVSWLKKNELDLKRHVQDLRDNITNNWTTTGQELSRELKHFWPASRPQSPARLSSTLYDSARSPTATGSGHGSSGGSASSQAGNSKDFVTGYALGLVGGVKSWMTKNRRTVTDSQPVSDDDSEESDSHGRQAMQNHARPTAEA